MPSNKKKHVRARMAKTGESYAAALRNLRGPAGKDQPRAPEDATAGTLPLKSGVYSGTPKLPPAERRTLLLDNQGNVLRPGPDHPEVEMVHIQGDFDPDDLDKAWVPETAFDDPTMPRHPSVPEGVAVKRVLTLKEYIDARKKQTGWTLFHIEPGAVKFLGKTLNVVLSWTVP